MVFFPVTKAILRFHYVSRIAHIIKAVFILHLFVGFLPRLLSRADLRYEHEQTATAN